MLIVLDLRPGDLDRIPHDLILRSKATNFADVRNFHGRFEVPEAETPSLLSQEKFDFRFGFLDEELTEFLMSYRENDLVGMADALVDLVYVAMGTAAMMGLPWQDLWDEVQRANMSKVRAQHAGQSKRGSALDVIKPEGWTGPDHYKILGTEWPTF